MADTNNRRPGRRVVGNTSYEETSRYSSRYSTDSSSGRTRRSSSRSSMGGGESLRGSESYDRYSRNSYGSAARRSGAAGSRRTTAGSGYNGGGRRPKGSGKKKLLIVLVAVLVVVGVGAGAAFAFLGNINNKLQSGVTDELLQQLENTQYTGDPFYVLLLGVDRSDDREEDEEFGTSDSAYRTDSMILARVDPVNKKATLISLPRDTMVDMGEYGTQKLNAAYSIGGPAYTVQIVSKLAGVPISHYAEVDFEGFCAVVDALGGVEVNVPIDIDDGEAGGSLKAGYQTLAGEDALILCRTRHTYDDQGAGDLYRAANQRMVLSAVAKKLLNSDPLTMVNAINVAADSVTTDLSVTDMIAIASSMRGLDPSTDIYTCSMPTTSQYIDGLWYEVLNQSKWTTMMKRVEAGESPTTDTVIDETTGTILSSSGDGTTSAAYEEESTLASGTYSGSVSVRNGSTTSGAAQKVANILENMGFTTDVGNADADTYSTTLVIYTNATQADAAAAIVNKLGVGRTMKNDGSYTLSGDILVVVGADYKG